MLSYFEDKSLPIDYLELVRREITLFANKGIIPTWEMFLENIPSGDSVSIYEMKDLFSKIVESSFLSRVLDPLATEFILHSPFKSQKLLPTGKKESIQLELEPRDWQLWIEMLSIRYRENWNVETPFASFYGELFGFKFRITLVHESISPQSISKVFLRRISSTPFKLENFGEVDILQKLIRSKSNVLIAGSTGSGKTSLLTSLIQEVPIEEHIVILEDTHEITAIGPHVTNLLSGKESPKDLSSYLTYALRMTPDRIILGEMRSHEIVPYLLAMNTGHKGILSTIHASSAVDALYRLALLFSLYSSLKQSSRTEIMELICRNLEYVVFMENKRIIQIIKIFGSENGVPYFDEVKLALP